MMERTPDLAAIDAKTTGRYDLYGAAHKCLRHGHTVMLGRLARADYKADQTRLLADLRHHLAMNHQHLLEEETYIHPLLERRAPGSTARIMRQHEEHRQGYGELETLIRRVEGASDADAVAMGRHLHLAFTLFVADDLAHMFEEEQRTWPLMCSVLSDEAMLAMERSIFVNYGRDALLYIVPHLAGGASLEELAERLRGMKSALPAADYTAIIDEAVRPSLGADDMARIEAMGLLPS